MRKKLHTLFQKGIFSCSPKSLNSSIDHNRAKELYFKNYACHMTMIKNGEYEEYCRYHIPKEIEYAWSVEVKNKLIMEICNERKFAQVFPLASVNLPENDIIDAFTLISKSPCRNEILKTIEQLKSLFEPVIYIKIINLIGEKIMYRKIYEQVYKKYFGAKIVIYKGSGNFLVIIRDRDGQFYQFLDADLKKLYPVDTYMENIGFTYDIENAPEIIDYTFDIDLEKYGYSQCPEYYRQIIEYGYDALLHKKQ